MKVLPDQRKIAEHQQSGQTLGRGMDFALVVLVFLGIGYVLDRWLGTRPAFMVGLVIFSVVGQFIKMYFEYTTQMKVHEAELVASRHSQPRHRVIGADVIADDLMVNDPVTLHDSSTLNYSSLKDDSSTLHDSSLKKDEEATQ